LTRGSIIPPKKEDGKTDPAQEIQQLKQQLQGAVQKAEELQQVAAQAQAKAGDYTQKNQIAMDAEREKHNRETQAEENRAAEASRQLDIDREHGMAKIQAELDAANEKARIMADADIEKARIAAEYHAQADIEKARISAESATQEPDEPQDADPQQSALMQTLAAVAQSLQALAAAQMAPKSVIRNSDGRVMTLVPVAQSATPSQIQ
jgi:hypothetical protein